MLRRLTIENFALIERADICWAVGWTALTGETGAGKSIVLDALGLVLGARADASILRDADKKCIVEAQFNLAPAAAQFALSHDLDTADGCVTIRRVIASGGRSRAFVGDEPVKLNLLRVLGALLVDFHGQDDGHRLFAADGRLHAIDAEGGAKLAGLLKKYSEAFEALRLLQAERAACLAPSTEGSSGDLDYLQFQRDELDQAGLEGLDWSGLEAELSTLEHAEEIQLALGAGLGALREGDGDGAGADALTRIQQAIASLGHAEKASPACRAIGERLRSVRIELEDVVGEIEQTAENVVVNPSKLERLSATRDTAMRLMAKHSATDPGELLERKAELSARLESAQHRLKRLAALDGEIAEAVELTEHRGLLLHERRSEAARALARKTVEMLKGLKMPAVELNWDWRQLEAPAAHGLYGHNLMFSANPGHQAQPIEKVASGGERSRLLLAIRAVLAQHAEVPTLILDEIDTGVSGEVADRMARLMASIAENTQVITITHLPQVAACAPHQQRISKHTDGGRARTQVEALDELQRVEELAGMLSGSEITDDARAQARQLRAAT